MHFFLNWSLIEKIKLLPFSINRNQFMSVLPGTFRSKTLGLLSDEEPYMVISAGLIIKNNNVIINTILFVYLLVAT